MPTRSDIKKAFDEILGKYDVWEAYLFGSYTRGDETPESDIDVRLLCGDRMRFGDLLDIEERLSGRLGRSVDIVSARPSQYERALLRNHQERRGAFVCCLKNEIGGLILNILEDAEKIRKRIEHFGMTEERFLADQTFEDQLAYDAITMPVYTIAEDASHLSDEAIEAMLRVSWRDSRIRKHCRARVPRA